MVRLREARLIRSNEKGVFGSLPSTSASCRFLSLTREPRPLAKTEKSCFANDSLASSEVRGGEGFAYFGHWSWQARLTAGRPAGCERLRGRWSGHQFYTSRCTCGAPRARRGTRS